ncbi:MAG: sterol desaturase family protein [Myxococcota bacterium]|nr:sterol desaturase family protein [Myxococcota bacterium]
MFRLILQGGAMATFLIAGRLFPRVAGVKLVNRDLVFNLVNGALLFLLVGLPLGFVAPLAEFGLVDMGWLPWSGAQLFLSFVLLDFSRYWLHRMGHRVPFLWSFHRVHHSVEYLDATAGLRMHVVDFLQLWALPVILFGVVMDTSSFAPWVIPAAMAIGVLFDGFQHANLRVDVENPLFRAWNLLFNNPHFHSWHHTRDGHLQDGNYGNTLVIWDRLFGSEVTQPGSPALYGVGGDQALQNDPLSWLLLRRREATS